MKKAEEIVQTVRHERASLVWEARVLEAVNQALEWAAQQCEEKYDKRISPVRCAVRIRAGKAHQ
jgi:hypothetical protein